MILVADSGSTKTDWICSLNNEIIQFNTQGINPYFTNAQDIYKILSKNKELMKYSELVSEVYFFGAGCLNIDKREIVTNGLSLVFKSAYISVDHDLMGSAYATCGNEQGLACILGTGSNIAFFDGEIVFSGKFGLGYILGDEASGSYFGKKLIVSFLHQTMPEDLSIDFFAEYNINKVSVIENIYQKPQPNTYIASFSKFMFKYRLHPYIQNLLKEGFQAFIDNNVKDYKNYQSLNCNFVGSIAYHFQEELISVFNENKINIGRIIQKPIERIYEHIIARENLRIN